MTTPTLPSTNALFNQTGPDHEFIAMTTPSLTETTMRESSEFAGELAQLNDRLIPAITKDRDEWKRKAEEAERDAARYRWLRGKARLEYINPRSEFNDVRMEWVFPKLFGMTCVMSEIPVDEAIDAAIAAKGVDK